MPTNSERRQSTQKMNMAALKPEVVIYLPYRDKRAVPAPITWFWRKLTAATLHPIHVLVTWQIQNGGCQTGSTCNSGSETGRNSIPEANRDDDQNSTTSTDTEIKRIHFQSPCYPCLRPRACEERGQLAKRITVKLSADSRK